MGLWTVPNDHTMPIINERQKQDILLPVVRNPVPEISIISGKLPPGMRLENNTVKGVPFEVSIDMQYTVVFRAERDDEFEDRTLNFIVTGSDGPQWMTKDGLLPVGNNGAYFILDNSIIDFQLVAVDSDIFAGDRLEYFISDNDGTLPPGITLTNDGRLTGVVEPLLALDKIYENGGYDQQPYSSLPLDYGFTISNDYQSIYYDLFDSGASTKIRNRRKLNRYYPFTVTVTDGDNFVKRGFNIYVVGDDFLSADNTVMQVSTGVFTADNTNIRTPVWITPRDLGYKRANNYTTIFLETLDGPELTGSIYYTLDKFNDDGSRSRLPRGLELDNRTGTLTGTIPYQSTALKNYKFTVRATRFADVEGAAEIVLTSYEDTLMGQRSFKVFKLDLTGLEDGINDVTALINQEIIINDIAYRILNVDTSNSDYDVIILEQTLGQDVTLIFSRYSQTCGGNVIYVNRLSETEKNLVIGKVLNFSNSESYTIIDAVNYYREPNPQLSDCEKELTLQETKLILDKNINVTLEPNQVFGFAFFKGESFTKLISTNRRDDINTPYKSKTFEIKIIGEVNSTVNWITDSYLGSIRAEFVSNLFVKAEPSVTDTTLVYEIVSGKLPNGLSLNYQGEIVGKVRQYTNSSTIFDKNKTTWDSNRTTFDGLFEEGLTRFDSSNVTWDNGLTSFDRQYKFTVRVQDRLRLAVSEKEFILDVLEPDLTTYTDIYAKPLLKLSQREIYLNFVSNTSIFDYSKIYRPSDENFGVQTDLKMLVYAGIEAKEIEEYIPPVQFNHKRKKFYLGEFKKAIAKNPGSNTIVYEVVYIEVIDPYQIGNKNTRKQYEIRSSTVENKTRYISNIGNMRDNIKTVGKRERDYLPLWMRTPQENYEIFNYTMAIPVCYCLPGTADDILLNIKNYLETTNFSIQGIDFDIDRYIIQRTSGNTQEQYIVFPTHNFNI